MSAAELSQLVQRMARATTDIRELMKYSDRPSDALRIEVLDLEKDLAHLINEVQLRELTKYRHRHRPAPATDVPDTIQVERCAMTGARQ